MGDTTNATATTMRSRYSAPEDTLAFTPEVTRSSCSPIWRAVIPDNVCPDATSAFKTGLRPSFRFSIAGVDGHGMAFQVDAPRSLALPAKLPWGRL